MGNIVLLDDLTINQIAAGEVIERPANVVKELVENSIDAGANKITIEIKNGGKTFIKVVDNGKGMEQDDMFLSLERHATSKIKNIEDLENNYTMGFRGEAMASIASISKLILASKTKNMLSGTKITAKAGEIQEKEECAMSTGTSVIVEDLFFNTPVRYKFLKQDATESKYIKNWVQKAALANTNISFGLYIDGKQVFKSTGNGKIEDIIYILYGKQIQENIIKVDYKYNNMKVTGVIGNTLVSRDNRNGQIIFLNKRNIKNSILANSIDQAFKGGVGIGKYGFCILNLEIPANLYDVNVHPTKMDVRFKNEEEIYRLMYHAIKESLLNYNFLGNDQKEIQKENYVENEYQFLNNKTNIKQEKEEITRDITRDVDYKYIGILFKTYIIVEIDEELYLIDQHAAHERILYEQIKNNYKNHISRNCQMMLIPEVESLTYKEMEFVKQNIELFKNTGFEIDVFGENTVKINGIPDLEYRGKSKNIFLDILDEMLEEQRTSIKDVEERFIVTVACKAAVKAGMDLEKAEVDNLIKNLLSLKNPYTCPHGRPTTIKIKKSDIIKKIG